MKCAYIFITNKNAQIILKEKDFKGYFLLKELKSNKELQICLIDMKRKYKITTNISFDYKFGLNQLNLL